MAPSSSAAAPGSLSASAAGRREGSSSPRTAPASRRPSSTVRPPRSCWRGSCASWLGGRWRESRRCSCGTGGMCGRRCGRCMTCGPSPPAPLPQAGEGCRFAGSEEMPLSVIPSNPLPSPARGRGAGGEGLLALAAAVVALLIRLPFTLNRMWDHDSVQFALGVEKYDLAAHQPHPPGYPLWIGILKVLAALGVDSLHGMVVLAVLGGAIGTGWMVLLVGRLVSEEDRLRAGLFAAALYAFDPLLWFYGELPLIYALEGGLTVVLAWAATRMEEGRRPFLLACGLFALAGGLRQSTMVLLAPLLLFGVWRTWRRGRLTPGLFFGGAALGAAVVLAWFLPLCVAAGGYGAYRRINAEHFATLLPQTSILYGAGWGALAHNVEVLTKWGLQGIVPGAVALLVLWIATPRKIVPGLRRLASQAPWILVWAGPPVLFFALFHITKAGYTLVHLPAL